MIHITRELSKDIYWTNGHWNMKPVEITGIKELEYDGFSIQVVDKNSGSVLSSCSISGLDNWRNRENNPSDPSFNNSKNNNHGVSVGFNFNKSENLFHLYLNLTYLSPDGSNGVRDMFSNGDFNFDIMFIVDGKEEKQVIQSVTLKDMSQIAIESRRVRKDSRYTEVKFWLGLLFGVPAKSFAGWVALVVANYKFPQLIVDYPFLSYVLHPLIPILVIIGLTVGVYLLGITTNFKNEELK